MNTPDPMLLFRGQGDPDAFAQALWRWQRVQNPVLHAFWQELGCPEEPVYLPLELFKTHEIRCGGDWEPAITFLSSATTGMTRSRHAVRDLSLYRESALAGWYRQFGSGNWTILALLPHYLEMGQSSLVWMADCFMKAFGNAGSGFFLHQPEALRAAIGAAAARGERVLLLGVAYALLDFLETGPCELPPGSCILETGGMKGRGRERTRAELHAALTEGFGIMPGSEYGMTELLSQAWAKEGGRYVAPPWLRVKIGEPSLPGFWLPPGEVGRIHIEDLANVHSCAFLRTEDLGMLHADGSFEVLGRLDYAEVRGCNLMSG